MLCFVMKEGRDGIINLIGRDRDECQYVCEHSYLLHTFFSVTHEDTDVNLFYICYRYKKPKIVGLYIEL